MTSRGTWPSTRGWLVATAIAVTGATAGEVRAAPPPASASAAAGPPRRRPGRREPGVRGRRHGRRRLGRAGHARRQRGPTPTKGTLEVATERPGSYGPSHEGRFRARAPFNIPAHTSAMVHVPVPAGRLLGPLTTRRRRRRAARWPRPPSRSPPPRGRCWSTWTSRRASRSCCAVGPWLPHGRRAVARGRRDHPPGHRRARSRRDHRRSGAPRTRGRLCLRHRGRAALRPPRAPAGRPAVRAGGLGSLGRHHRGVPDQARGFRRAGLLTTLAGRSHRDNRSAAADDDATEGGAHLASGPRRHAQPFPSSWAPTPEPEEDDGGGATPIGYFVPVRTTPLGPAPGIGPLPALRPKLVGYSGGNLRPSAFGATAPYGLGQVHVLAFRSHLLPCPGGWLDARADARHGGRCLGPARAGRVPPGRRRQSIREHLRVQRALDPNQNFRPRARHRGALAGD